MGQTFTKQHGGFVPQLPAELNYRVLSYTSPRELYDATRTSKLARTYYNDYSKGASKLNDTFEDAVRREDIEAMHKFYDTLKKKFEHEEEPLLQKYPNGSENRLFEKEIAPTRNKYLNILENLIEIADSEDASPKVMETLAKMYQEAIMSWGQNLWIPEYAGWPGFDYIYDNYTRWNEVHNTHGYPILKSIWREMKAEESDSEKSDSDNSDEEEEY